MHMHRVVKTEWFFGQPVVHIILMYSEEIKYAKKNHTHEMVRFKDVSRDERRAGTMRAVVRRGPGRHLAPCTLTNFYNIKLVRTNTELVHTTLYQCISVIEHLRYYKVFLCYVKTEVRVWPVRVEMGSIQCLQ